MSGEVRQLPDGFDSSQTEHFVVLVKLMIRYFL